MQFQTTGFTSGSGMKSRIEHRHNQGQKGVYSGRRLKYGQKMGNGEKLGDRYGSELPASVPRRAKGAEIA